tara:strand:- start:5904 stop:7076 length:1173 start_codon:yes stop_codon:yes gene_type:complete
MISLPYVLVGLYKTSQKNNVINICFIASLFTIAEYIKSILFGGFPWLLIGHSQNQTIFDSMYPVFGSYAISYIVVLLSLLVLKSIKERNSLYISIAFLSFTYYLLAPINQNNLEQENNLITYTIYQPNVYPSQSYNPDQHSMIMRKYINMIDENKSSDLIIFPETILPIPFDERNDYYLYFKSLTSDRSTLISGLFTKEQKKYYNSMVFFSDDIQIYNKRKLVPFGEYTPWYDSLIKIAGSLRLPLSNLSHGSKQIENITIGSIKIIPMICFESTFPDLITSNSSNEIIVNISNDAWFGNTLAPYQHLQITQIRALEFNRYILRATNTGISAVIDNKGHIVDHIEHDVEGTMRGAIPTKMNRSFYSEYGDIVILMLIFFSLISRGLIRVT